MGCITSRSSTKEGEESSRRSPAAEVLEDDDLLSEILLRLPPQPSSLPRASLVCKRWRCLLSDPSFSRRFRIHHRRNPPLLGFFYLFGYKFVPTLEAPNRIPPGRFSLNSFVYLGCRHGLVLMLVRSEKQVLVWDPFTGDQHRIALPPGLYEEPIKTSGAVLRAEDFQHFQVVLVVATCDGRTFVCVYSSETGKWGNLVSTPLASCIWGSFTIMPSVLAGGSLYWMINIGASTEILEFHLESQSLTLIPIPLGVRDMAPCHCRVTRAVGGGLGLLIVSDFCANLWERKADCDGIVSWVLGRTVDLDILLSLNSEKVCFSIQGFAEDNNVLFLWSTVGSFMIHLESLKFKKIFDVILFHRYHPFESVYAAGI